MTNAWEPPSSLEERLVGALLPPRLYYWVRAHRERLSGEPELGLLPTLVDPGRNSVDVGANKGVYTYWLQRCSRHVYAYEPNPKMFRILHAAAGGNVTVSPVALSDATGTSMLRVPKTMGGYSNQGASLNYRKVGPDYGEVAVETRRLDDAGLADVGFIKIDVEGHEMAVIEGGRELIARDRPTLLVEIEEAHTGRPIEDSLGRIVGLGYRGFAVLRGAPMCVETFDVTAHNRAASEPGDYVYNFVFRPKK